MIEIGEFQRSSDVYEEYRYREKRKNVANSPEYLSSYAVDWHRRDVKNEPN